MQQQHNEARLRTLLTELSKRDTAPISLDDDLLEALDLDSLGALRMLAAVEKHFGVRFPDDELSQLRTLRRLLDGIPLTEQEERTS